MNRKPLAPTLAVLAMVLTGCATLRVRTSVINPAVVETEVDRGLRRDQLPLVLAETEESLRARINAFSDLHRGCYEDLSKVYQEAANDSDDVASASALRQLSDDLLSDWDVIAPKYETLWTSVADFDARIQEPQAEINELSRYVMTAQHDDPAVSEKRERRSRLQQLQNVHLRQRMETLRAFVLAMHDDLTGCDRQFRTELERLSRENLIDVATKDAAIKDLGGLPAEAQVLEKDLLGGQGVLDSPFLYALAAAPEVEWKRSSQTWGKARWGSMNVALKMLSPLDFTIKGLTFDPSDVVRAISKVTTQALILSAQLSGVPVRTTGTAAGEGAALATSSTNLADSSTAAADATARLKAYRREMYIIARAIVSERTELEGQDAARRREAIDAIKARYEAHKDSLRLTQEGQK